jgi:hypothetical protein
MARTGAFDTALRTMKDTEWKDATIHACDSADMARLWFESHGLEASTADIVALAALIVGQHREIVYMRRASELGDDP